MHCETTFKLRISIACLTNLRIQAKKATALNGKADDQDMILKVLSSEIDPAEISFIQ
jgi:hypothetical protein